MPLQCTVSASRGHDIVEWTMAMTHHDVRPEPAQLSVYGENIEGA